MCSVVPPTLVNRVKYRAFLAVRIGAYKYYWGMSLMLCGQLYVHYLI